MEAITMDHRIIILGDKGRVVPAVVIVGANDRVTFEAHHTVAVVDFHVERGPFGEAKLKVDPIGTSASQTVSGEPGVYPYSVWCDGPPGRSASGDSDPIIIIKRPS